MGMAETIALVTGASRGLGAAVAEHLGKPGTHIISLARTVGALEELDDRIAANGGSASLAVVDIAKAEPLRELCAAIFERWGRIDLLIHGAIHAPPLSPTAQSDRSDLKQALRTNVLATSELIVCCEPLLKQSRGAIAVFFDDPRAGERFFSGYGSSKAAQLALARSWQAETRNTGPSVRIFRPNPMRTSVRRKFYPGESGAGLADPSAEAKRLISELQAEFPDRTL